MADYISQFTGGEIDRRLAKVSDLEAGKQDKLESGENIKTVGGQSLLGAGNIPLTDQEAVKFTPQTLTAAQKAQAQANIGAASEEEVAALADQKYEGPYATSGDLPAASASTMGAIYLVGPDANGEYDRYVTKLNGSTYTWASLGKTSIDLANYATKAEVGELEAKVDEITAEETLDLDEEIKVVSEDGETTILEINENGVNAKDLKSNGVSVLTSHQDISGLATKEELELGLEEKQDVIEEVSIDDTKTSSANEQIWASDDYNEDTNAGEMYAKVNENGLFVKDLKRLNGTPFVNEILAGKKWAVLGDSFTAGDGLERFPDGPYAGYMKTYPYLISLRTGIVLYKFFNGGRTLAFPAIPGDFINSVTNPNVDFYYQNIPADADYITIYLGINDSHHAPGSSGGDGEDNTGEIPIGSITDTTTATFYGAWNVVLSWLIENRPFSHIGIIVSNGCGDVSYRNAMIAVARKYGVPFLDLNGDDRTPFMLRTSNPDIDADIKLIRMQKQSVDFDGTKTGTINRHPNENAHLFESYSIENFLRTI